MSPKIQKFCTLGGKKKKIEKFIKKYFLSETTKFQSKK
jgi:hypothetical protein